MWDLIVAVLHGNTYQSNQERGDPCTNLREVRAAPYKHQMRKKFHGMVDDLDNVDFISSNVNSSRQEALLYVFEDNEAVIKVIMKGRSPSMRHVSRTQRVALDWLFDRINLDPKIQIKYSDTKNQLAHILTKGNFTRDEWNHLLCLFHVSHFSSINSVKAMSKRTQEYAGEERVTAKSKPMMNLVSRCSERTPDVLASTASESLGKTRHESQLPLSSWNEQHQRTGRPVLDAYSSSYSEWNADNIILFVVVRSFTVESNLLQPTESVNNTPSHVTFCRVLHAHFNVARDIGSRCLVRITSCHLAFGCAFDLILFDPLLCTLHRLSHLPFHSLVLHLHLPFGLVR